VKTERSVKLIRKEKRQQRPVVEVESDDPKIWSTEVKSWIVKFQQRRRIESLPAFNSLFQ